MIPTHTKLNCRFRLLSSVTCDHPSYFWTTLATSNSEDRAVIWSNWSTVPPIVTGIVLGIALVLCIHSQAPSPGNLARTIHTKDTHSLLQHGRGPSFIAPTHHQTATWKEIAKQQQNISTLDTSPLFICKLTSGFILVLSRMRIQSWLPRQTEIVTTCTSPSHRAHGPALFTDKSQLITFH